MGKSNYDDWNFMGQSLTADSESGKINYGLNSTLFLLSFLALSLFGIVSIYSATYYQAQILELSEFDFALKQIIYLFVGIAGGLILFFLPEKALSATGYVLVFSGLGVLTVNSIVGNNYLANEVFQQILIFINIVFYSAFFAAKKNTVDRLRDLLIPVFCITAMVFFIMIQKNITFAFVYFIVSLVLFICGGVGAGGALLLILFALVPTVCTVLSDEKAVLNILKVIVPGFGTQDANVSSALYKIQAVSSGRLFGRGIGAGQFKYGMISDISGSFILCNICEELGFAGLVLIVAFFFILAFTGFKTAYSVKDESRFAFNLVNGIITHVLLCFFINVFSCFNLIDVDCISLPFLSYGPSSIVFTMECFLVFRFARNGGNPNE